MGTFRTPRRRKTDARRRQAQEARWAARRPSGELTSAPEPDGSYAQRMRARELADQARQAAQPPHVPVKAGKGYARPGGRSSA